MVRQGGAAFHSALIALDFEFPSEALMRRICAQEDLEFVCRENPVLEREFLRERKDVALVWLREARDCVVKLFRLHRLVARRSASVDLANELATLVNFMSFLVLVGTAKYLIQFFGPFRARRIIGMAFTGVTRLSFAVGQVVAGLEPALRAGIHDEWTTGAKAIR